MSEDIRIKIIANTEPYYIKFKRLNRELMTRVSAQKCPICEVENREITRFELMEL